MRRGLTLIELLVSIGLAMILLLLATMALMQITRVAKRDVAQRQAHDDAGIIYRTMSASVGAMYHSSQMRFEVDGDSISLIWMSALRNTNALHMEYSPQHVYDLVWNQVRWTKNAATGGGTLEYAVSSPRRTAEYTYANPDGNNYTPTISNAPQVRRDRRRDMNDNDLRHVPGMTGAQRAVIALPGDADDLLGNLHPLHATSSEITDCRFQWIDAEGYVVRCDPDNGITVEDPAGGNVDLTLTPLPWSKTTRYVIDGSFLDGREHVDADRSRTVSGQRPALVMIQFTVVPTTNSGRALADEPEFPFTFTFPAAPTLPDL